MLVFSYTDRESFTNIRNKWHYESQSNASNKNPPVVVVGNKCDLDDPKGEPIDGGLSFAFLLVYEDLRA